MGDCTGGSLSLLQQILSAYNTDDWNFVTENVPKFLLGCLSLVFDTVFMLQHYVLYGDNDSLARQSKTALLEKECGSIEDRNLNYSSVKHLGPATRESRDVNSIVIREQLFGQDVDVM